MEMFKGFQFHIPNLKHVICYKHFKDNVETYLRGKLSDDASYENVHFDIFGTLVESPDEEAFDESLNNLKSLWDAIHPDLFRWFERYQATTIKSSLLPSRRADAGLGTDCFYNNANESINNILKLQTSRKSSISDIVVEWQKIAAAQEMNCKRAIFSQGPYSLKAKFKDVGVPESTYYRMPPSERANVLGSGILSNMHSGKRVGRKPSETPRKRARGSTAKQFCNKEYKHNDYVYFVLLGNCQARKCYSCSADFHRSEEAEVVGVVQTRRKYFDRTTGKLTISKRPQAAYCHIKCLGKKEDYDKDYHICNYMEAYITKADMSILRMFDKQID